MPLELAVPAVAAVVNTQICGVVCRGERIHSSRGLAGMGSPHIGECGRQAKWRGRMAT